jgi:predicted PurR-regulated permease PerM
MTRLGVDRARTAWWAVTAVLFLVVVFVVYSFVGTFVFAIFIYYATRPAYHRIYRRLPRRTVVGRDPRRSIAAALALMVLALPAIALLGYTLAIALQEAANLQQIDLGPFESFIQPYVNVSGIVENPADILQQDGGIEVIRETAVAALGYLGFIGNGLLHLFVMFALAFYLLRDGPRLSRWLLRFGDEQGVLRAYARAVDTDLKHIFFGNILNAIMTGAIGAISFSLLNYVAPAGLTIPYPALTGLLAGAASLIPVVGMKLVYVPLVGYLGFEAILSGGGYSFVFLFFAVSFVIVDSVPDFVLRPYVSGRNLHVGLVMFAYILGPLLFGWYGIFLGPILLVFIVHFGRIVLPELLANEQIRPVAVDPGALTGSKGSPSPDDTNVEVSDGGSTDGTHGEEPAPDD